MKHTALLPLPVFSSRVVSWSNKWVYFVRLLLPKSLTCMTLGKSETSTVDVVASV